MSKLAIAFVIIIAGLDLVGWLFDIPFLKSVNPHLTVMRIIMAICFLVSAAALTFLQSERFVRQRKRIVVLSGAAVSAVGLLVTATYFLERVSRSQWSGVNNPLYLIFLTPTSRMTLITAILFFSFGCVIILLGIGNRRSSDAAHIVLIPISMVSYLIIVGVLFDIPSLHTWLGTSVAHNANVAFFGLCLAAFCVRPDTWFMSVFTLECAGAAMARRLLPFLFLLPLTIGWLRLQGERAGVFGSEIGVAIVAVTYTFSFLWLVWRISQPINRTDLLRQRAEDVVVNAKQAWERTFDTMPDLIAILDCNHRITRVNRAMAQRLGRKPSECIGQYCFREIHGTQGPPSYCPHSLLLADGNEHIAEIHEDALSGDFLVSTTPLTDTKGRVCGSVHVARDISELKKKEKELCRLNNTLKAYSDSSHALSRAKSEHDFLDEACRILIEDCGYQMIWIGFAMEDEEKTVHPAAWAGFEDGYLEKLQVSWADTERGRGPTGRAIRNGKTVKCANMQIDPDFAPWRQEAIRRGYSSSIVIPLITDGKAIGAISIYSREIDPFLAEEESLLGDIANDLSNGIAMIRLQATKKKADDELIKAKNELELRIGERTADLQKAMVTLEAQRRRFDDVLNMLPVYVILLTPQYHAAFANKFFLERFGESHGKRCFEFLFNRTEPCEICETFKPFTTHAPSHWEWTGPDRRNYDIYDFPFTDTDGSPLILEMGIDITDRIRAEAALREANEMKLLGQLTSGVAHEVRNPLNGIMAIMGALAKELSDNDQFQPYMQHMRNQVTRLTTLMDDLLVLGRPLREENMHVTSLATLVESALLTWLQTVQQHKPLVQLIIPEPPEQYLIRADDRNMIQMIINLLENAYHHSPEGSEIVCSINSQTAADTIILCVKDCGTGIAEELLPRIFDPFFTTRKDGTGLGLSIVRHIVELHQGSIFACNNTDGPGATFEVLLPLSTIK
jgi:PAS domain S-box-containing protein